MSLAWEILCCIAQLTVRVTRGAMRPLILLALITPSARACFDETRGGCYTAGFVDNLSSADDCQAACAFDSACEFFAYHAARGDRRCHFCHDDRDVSQCAANVNNPSADARWRNCVLRDGPGRVSSRRRI